MAIFENVEGKAVILGTGKSAEAVKGITEGSMSSNVSRMSAEIHGHDAQGHELSTSRTETRDAQGHFSSVETEKVQGKYWTDVKSIATDAVGHKTESLSRIAEVPLKDGSTERMTLSVSQPVDQHGRGGADLRMALDEAAMGARPTHPGQPTGVTITESREHISRGVDGSTRNERMTDTFDTMGRETRGLDLSSTSISSGADGKRETVTSLVHQDDHGIESASVTRETSSATGAGGPQFAQVRTESMGRHDDSMEGKWMNARQAHVVGESVHQLGAAQALHDSFSAAGEMASVPKTSMQDHLAREGVGAGAVPGHSPGKSWSFGGAEGAGGTGVAGLPSHTSDSLVGYLQEKFDYAAHEAKALVGSISEQLHSVLGDHVPGSGGQLQFHKTGDAVVSVVSGHDASHGDMSTASVSMDRLKEVHESGRVQSLDGDRMIAAAARDYQMENRGLQR